MSDLLPQRSEQEDEVYVRDEVRAGRERLRAPVVYGGEQACTNAQMEGCLHREVGTLQELSAHPQTQATRPSGRVEDGSTQPVVPLLERIPVFPAHLSRQKKDTIPE